MELITFVRELYVNPVTGKVWQEGDMIVEPALARTLDIIAEGGPEEIHNGSLTATLVSDIQRFGGIITEDDLRNYKYARNICINKQHYLEYTSSKQHHIRYSGNILNLYARQHGRYKRYYTICHKHVLHQVYVQILKLYFL